MIGPKVHATHLLGLIRPHQAAVQKARLLEPVVGEIECFIMDANPKRFDPDDIRRTLVKAAPLFADLQATEQQLLELVIFNRRQAKRARGSLG